MIQCNGQLLQIKDFLRCIPGRGITGLLTLTSWVNLKYVFSRRWLSAAGAGDSKPRRDQCSPLHISLDGVWVKRILLVGRQATSSASFVSLI